MLTAWKKACWISLWEVLFGRSPAYGTLKQGDILPFLVPSPLIASAAPASRNSPASAAAGSFSSGRRTPNTPHFPTLNR